jgi:hypothetical protein
VPVCKVHCPPPARGGWGWLLAVIAAVAVLLAGARAAAPALGRLLHDVILWGSVAAFTVSAGSIFGYVAVSAVRDRRRGGDAQCGATARVSPPEERRVSRG